MFGIRSILAIVIGFVVSIAIVMGTFTFMEQNNPAIHTKMSGQVVLLAFACFGGLVGGFVTASVAAKHRRFHAILLGLLMCGLGLVLHVFFPDRGSEHDPAWYSYGMPILALISATVGGRLRSRN